MPTGNHGQQSGAALRIAEVAGDMGADTCTGDFRLNDIQRVGEPVAKQMLKDAASDVCGAPAIGLALGKSTHYGKKLCNASDPLSITLRDLMAIGLPSEARSDGQEAQPDFTRKVLELGLRALDEKQPIREMPLHTAVYRLNSRVGEMNELMARINDPTSPGGEEETPGELRQLESRIRTVANAVNQMLADVGRRLARAQAERDA